MPYSLRFFTYTLSVLTACLVVTLSASAAAAAPAFPGAEGFGAAATGGRGGSVYFVTNLNTSGVGSFTECVKQSNTTCIFKVGGVINYGETELVISGSNLTIAGQTAPGGITIRGMIKDEEKSALVNLQGSNIIMRHLRIRGGGDTLRVVGAKNVMLDHLSLSWATDENFGGTTGAQDITLQWSLIGEGVIGHSKGVILTTAANKFSFHHNVFAHNEERHPRMQTGSVEFINNIIFNHNAGSTIETRSGHDYTPIELNYIGNLLIDGPNLGPGDTWYQKNLSIKEGKVFLADNNHGYQHSGGQLLASKNNFSMPYPVSVAPVTSIKTPLLQKAGAFFFSRDSVDTRIIDETTKGIKNPQYAQSYPEVSEIVWPSYPTRQSTVVDADNDGMDDAWERSKGLNPAVNDGKNITASGYSNLELYLNELAQDQPTLPPIDPPPTPDPTPEPSPNPSPDPTPDPTPNPSPDPTPETEIPADIAPVNALDGLVTILDYNLLIQLFAQSGNPGFHRADINKNGVVDIFDYNTMLQAFTP